MSFEPALRALLTSYAPLTALVGGSATPRIYWNAIPQDATDPCVALYKITGAPGIHMQGSDGLTNSLVQINVRALTVTSMWAVRDAIVDRLHCHKSVVGNIDFRGIFLGDERQASEKPSTVLYHTAQLDFSVWSGLVT